MTSRVDNDAELPEGVVLLGKIDIHLYLPVDSGVPIVRTQFVDGHGDTLPLIQALGMLDIARNTCWDLHNGDLEEHDA